jgi:nitrogen fixation/metabolism regulation signal transduction histidine kinase
VNAETWVLIAAAVVAATLVALALAFQRGDRSLRARLVITFVALALVPALTTLAVLLPDLTTRRHLQASEAFQRSMESALVLARVRHIEAQAIADSAVARLRRGASTLDGLADETYVALLFAGKPASAKLLVVHGGWSPEAAHRFLETALVGWPVSPLARPVPGPDGTPMAAAVAGPMSPDSTGARYVLAGLHVADAEATAIQALDASIRPALTLGRIEQNWLVAGVRLLAGLALFFLVVAMVLGMLLARSLTLPVERLMRGVEAVAEGDLGAEVHPVPRGELGRLTAGFNRMSRELRESKEQLVRAARLAAWQGVARRLAHEIKNPLTPITLSIHRLRGRVPAEDPVALDCLDTILEETTHLERLANEFSSFARLPKPDLQPVEPDEVLRQVLELYSAHSGMRLHAQFDGVPRVLADRDQVRQVFTNLVKNSVEAMPQGGELVVRWGRENGRVAFTFLDTGSGFQETALQHLFDPTFTTKPGGTGLGLAIVRRILEEHGGDIQAGNRPEGGAWVRVLLREAD